MANREILFRRVHRDRRNGQSRENGAIQFTFWGFANGGFEGPYHIPGWDTVCDEQYAGLKDRNGAKIFEGDVVSENQDDSIWQVYFDTDHIQWMCHSNKIDDTLPLCEWNSKTEMQVIGNIHDQPELLTLNQESK